MSTPHNSANPGDIAKTVIMSGDPLRAKFMAEHFLENPKQFNGVRNMLGYTGTYQGKPVSVMGHGMGIPSVAIYSYELYHFYDVEQIIRVGTAGCLHKGMDIGDLVVAQGRAPTPITSSSIICPEPMRPLPTMACCRGPSTSVARWE